MGKTPKEKNAKAKTWAHFRTIPTSSISPPITDSALTMIKIR